MKPASRKRKPREPKPILDSDDETLAEICNLGYDFENNRPKNNPIIDVCGQTISPKQARKLAAWLLRAADYLEQKGPK